MPTYNCQTEGCNGKIHSADELIISPNLLCDKCRFEKIGDRNWTKATLIRTDGHKCIIQGCPWKPKGRAGYHVHRIIPGRNGGRYVPENCVLVCPHHHKPIEGKTKREILEMKCTDAQINGMDLYHTTNYLEDYPKDFIETAAKYMCDMLGVPLKTNKYDLVEVIVKGINDAR